MHNRHPIPDIKFDETEILGFQIPTHSIPPSKIVHLISTH
jgi:hypothetical protein